MFRDKQGTPEEGWRIQQLKHCVSTNNNKNGNNSLKNQPSLLPSIEVGNPSLCLKSTEINRLSISLPISKHLSLLTPFKISHLSYHPLKLATPLYVCLKHLSLFTPFEPSHLSYHPLKLATPLYVCLKHLSLFTPFEPSHLSLH